MIIIIPFDSSRIVSNPSPVLTNLTSSSSSKARTATAATTATTATSAKAKATTTAAVATSTAAKAAATATKRKPTEELTENPPYHILPLHPANSEGARNRVDRQNVCWSAPTSC